MPENIAIRGELIALGLDPGTGMSEGTVSALAFDISRSTVDDPLDAHSGYTLAGRVERADRWLRGTFSYLAVTAEGRHYFPLGSRLLVANRLRLGSIRAHGDLETNVPFYKRYFLGGSSSIRGWGRFEVGPIDSFGQPVGGHSMLEGSSELYAPSGAASARSLSSTMATCG